MPDRYVACTDSSQGHCLMNMDTGVLILIRLPSFEAAEDAAVTWNESAHAARAVERATERGEA